MSCLRCRAKLHVALAVANIERMVCVRARGHRTQVHARITTTQLQELLAPVIHAATRVPSHRFTVFFDEVNTASILGVIQTIMVDRRLAGQKLPPNIFWAAAANPFRKRQAAAAPDGGKTEEGAVGAPSVGVPGVEGGLEAQRQARRDRGDTAFEDWYECGRVGCMGSWHPPRGTR